MTPLEARMKVRLERDSVPLVSACREYYDRLKVGREDEVIVDLLGPSESTRAEAAIRELLAAFDSCSGLSDQLVAAEDLADAVVRFVNAREIRDRTPPSDSVEFFYDIGSMDDVSCTQCSGRLGFFHIEDQRLCAHCAQPHFPK